MITGLELFLLGRRLMKLGQRAVSSGTFERLPTSVQTVLIDVFEHPDTTIGEIVARTGLVQSHVSTSVVRLRKVGVLEARRDPEDGRRTLIRPTPGIRDRVRDRGTVSATGVLAEALGTADLRAARRVESQLASVARELARHRRPGAAARVRKESL